MVYDAPGQGLGLHASAARQEKEANTAEADEIFTFVLQLTQGAANICDRLE